MEPRKNAPAVWRRFPRWLLGCLARQPARAQKAGYVTTGAVWFRVRDVRLYRTYEEFHKALLPGRLRKCAQRRAAAPGGALLDRLALGVCLRTAMDSRCATHFPGYICNVHAQYV